MKHKAKSSEDELRKRFEEWVSGPPYEREIDRWPMDEENFAWPGQYIDIIIQLAWEAWNEATEQQRTKGTK